MGVGKTRLANEFLETCRILIGDDIFIQCNCQQTESTSIWCSDSFSRKY